MRSVSVAATRTAIILREFRNFTARSSWPLLASCAASPPAAAFVPWSSLLGEPAGDYTIEACLSAECFRFWLAKDNKERKQKTSKQNSLCLLYRRILTSVATQKCQKINPPTRQDRNPDSYDIHSRNKSTIYLGMQTPRNNPISILQQQQQEPRPFLSFREADRQQSDLFPLNSKKTHKMQVRGEKN